MSLLSGNALPTSDFSKSAQYINLENAHTAAQSLSEAHENFQGKVLFYREGDNYFAVAKKNRPLFFFKKLLCCSGGNVPHYANDEVGDKLADLFGEDGKQLQAKMNFGWFKTAVDSKEFLNTIAGDLTKRAEDLQSELGSEWEEIDRVLNDTATAPPSSLTQLASLIDRLKTAKTLDRETLDSQRKELASIQFDFWNSVENPQYDTDSLMEDPHVGDEINSLFKSHEVPDKELGSIYQAGLANQQTLNIRDKWIGHETELVDVLVDKANALTGHRNAILDRIASFAVRAAKTEPNDNHPTREHLAALSHAMALLTKRMGKLDDSVSYAEQVEELKNITRDFDGLEPFLLEAPPANQDALDRAVAVYKLSTHLENVRFFNKDNYQVEFSLSTEVRDDNSVVFETIQQHQRPDSENLSIEEQVYRFQQELHQTVTRRLDEESEDGTYMVADRFMTADQLNKLDQQLSDGKTDDPLVGALLSEHLQRPVTIYQYDQSSDQVIEHKFDGMDPDAQRILLAMDGRQFYGVEQTLTHLRNKEKTSLA